MAAGRVVSSDAISTRFFSLVCSNRPSLAEVVVLPEPCRPTIRMGAGGEPMDSAAFSTPRVSTRTSWTILITCWPGVTERMTFSPTARGGGPESRDGFREGVGVLGFATGESQITRRLTSSVAPDAMALSTKERETIYIAGLVIPVPADKMEAYREWARNSATFFKEYG